MVKSFVLKGFFMIFLPAKSAKSLDTKHLFFAEIKTGSERRDAISFPPVTRQSHAASGLKYSGPSLIQIQNRGFTSGKMFHHCLLGQL
jgi:hypothetical protein